MSGSNFLSYVERGGDEVLRQPFHLQGVQLRGFLLEGDKGRLQALCDRSFNEPSGGAVDFRPLSRAVLLTFATMRASSLDSRDRSFGWGPETDVAFWVPVLAGRGDTTRLLWLMPYVFVDNPFALAAGREVYGFPKSLGDFSIPKDPAGRDPYTVDVLGLRRHAPETQALRQRLFQVDRDAAGWQPASLLGGALALPELLGLMLGDQRGVLSQAGAGLLHLENLLVHRRVTAAFLRQLRHVADPTRAAFQEIVEAPFRLEAVRRVGLLPGRFTLRCQACDSHPVARDLGLCPEGRGQEVKTAFSADFDFVVEHGQRLWAAQPALPAPEAEAAEPAPAEAAGRQKVAVLGGGIGALTAAFQLTELPGWQDRYEITIYQMGWRLGGKGASGRNQDRAQRIEEHGLHIWFGFYENAFRVMRRCYEELGRPEGAALRTWQEAFVPHCLVALAEVDEGQLRSWALRFPTNDAVPGEGAAEGPRDWVRVSLEWLRQHIHAALSVRLEQVGGGAIESLLAQSAFGAVAAVLAVVERATGALSSLPIEEVLPPELLRQARARLRQHLADAIAGHDELRRLFVALDLLLSGLVGILEDDLLRRGFEVIDDEDFVAWLGRHGAAEVTRRSAPIRALYDLTFAFAGGDTARPDFAAGVCLKGALRMLFGYRGAFMWKMQAGMGDVVFAPMYEVLRRRGVRFQFFHRVKDLALTADGDAVGAIRIGRQAALRGPEYAPLIDVKGLPCWPDRPRYEQLVQGEALRQRAVDLESPWAQWRDAEERTLLLGRDFDLCVLGIPVGALPDVCGEIIAAKPAWRRMVDNVRTVCTQSAQLWLRSDLQHLSWPGAAAGERGPVLSAFSEPLDTWADMTHLCPREDWPERAQPGHLAYLCGPLSEPPEGLSRTDPEVPGRQRERVREALAAFLQRDAARLWPGAAAAGLATFDHELLVDPEGRKGAARIEAQYLRANIEPSGRYVLSVKGSPRHRLRADGSGLRNLFLTGDWIDNGLNAGCVEAAVMAGLQCARALSGVNVLIVGEPERLGRQVG